MKKMRQCLAAFLSALSLSTAGAEEYSWTNSPGGEFRTNYTIAANSANLAITVQGTSNSYSHVYLKRGDTPPSTNDYDFSCRTTGTTNGIYLERPELSAANYQILVITPATSQTHSFKLLVETNQTNLRTASRPVSRALDSLATNLLLAPNINNYYRVELRSTKSWRISLDSTSTQGPDLYVQSTEISTKAFTNRSTSPNNNFLAFQDSPPGIYNVGVFPTRPGLSSNYNLRIAPVNFKNAFPWDQGNSHLGDRFRSNSATAEDYYFEVTTPRIAPQGWRIALGVMAGEADLYLSREKLPAPTAADTSTVADYKSERVGSDGFVLKSPGGFKTNEVWYVLVRAKAGAEWTLVSGTPYVQDLGDGGQGEKNAEIGPEGMRYFSATPNKMLAWRLYLNGLTNMIYVQTNSLPFTMDGQSFRSEPGRMLMVPPDLDGKITYYVGIAGEPGTPLKLDSGEQEIINLEYNGGVATSLGGFGYATYRVVVPSTNQLPWEVSLTFSNATSPNLAVRSESVPNMRYNDAFLETSAGNNKSITLVEGGKDGLKSGVNYITIYPGILFTTSTTLVTLTNRPSEIVAIPLNCVITNTAPPSKGWRFFSITNNVLSGWRLWDLRVTSAPGGTRIAICHTNVPGQWTSRAADTVKTNSHFFKLSEGNFLQVIQPQTGLWYVGVHNPDQDLGPFTLFAGDYTPEVLTTGLPVARANVPNGRREIFSVTVGEEDLKTNAYGGPVLGWDLRLTNVTSGSPQLYVRYGDYPFMDPQLDPQYRVGADWTLLPNSSGGVDESGRMLVMGNLMGNLQLKQGTYYVEVFNRPEDTNAMSYKVLSRWIREGGTNGDIPVKRLDYTNGVATISLNPRDSAYYSVVIPPNSRSWKVQLECTNSEGILLVSTNVIPTCTNYTKTDPNSTRMDQAVNAYNTNDWEHFLMLPTTPGNSLVAGTNYLVVVAKGRGPASPRIGTNEGTFTIRSMGEMEVKELGDLTNRLTNTNSLMGGESAAYHFTTITSNLGFTVSLEGANTGSLKMVSMKGKGLPKPNSPYGVLGGLTGGTYGTTNITRVMKIGGGGDETVVVTATDISTNDLKFPVTYKLTIEPIDPASLLPNGGTISVKEQPAVAWKFFKFDVPANALGWDLRLTNVTGMPKIVVSRDVLPDGLTDILVTLKTNSFPSGGQLAATSDWTERKGPTGVDESGRILAMGMGRPLQPGTYYVGVTNTSPTTNASYTILSRGIGDVGSDYPIKVKELDFSVGTNSTSLAPREAVYYRVTVPANAASWKIALANTAGENLFAVLKDCIPNIGAARGDSSSKTTDTGGRKLQKIGDEQFVLLPTPGQDFLVDGNYYIAVVGEGQPVNDTVKIGTNSSSFTITSLGQAQSNNMGTVGPNELTLPDTLSGGETHFYSLTCQINQGFEVRLTNGIGNPVMVLVAGTRNPDPGTGLDPGIKGEPQPESYGSEGGERVTSTGYHTNHLIVKDPTSTAYRLAIKARSAPSEKYRFPDASYNLRILGITIASPPVEVDLAFDGGSNNVITQATSGWSYFKVVVPDNKECLGWDIRLKDVTSGLPRLVVRCDAMPTSSITTVSEAATNWPSGYQLAAGLDWTGVARQYSPSGVDEQGRILAMGMGKPLVAGTYYVGVTNTSPTNSASYTILSRGIGKGFAIPVVDLPVDGTITNPLLAPREAAYYKIVIPMNVPNWRMKLACSQGEAMCVALQDKLPNTSMTNATQSIAVGKAMQQPGNEHLLLLPGSGTNAQAPTTMYLAVVSEGVNPGTTRIGANTSAYTLETSTNLVVTNLGRVASLELIHTNTLESGEVKAYQFTIPRFTKGVKVTMEQLAKNIPMGDPSVVISYGGAIPNPNTNRDGKVDNYGAEGGFTGERYSLAGGTNLHIPSPRDGDYTVTVKARGATATVTNPALFKLKIAEILVDELNFSAGQNTNGFSNMVAVSNLAASTRRYYKVLIPATNPGGQPLLGWRLDLTTTSGAAKLRVRKDLLPGDPVAGMTNLMAFTNNSCIVAPPFLTNGTWFVEVEVANTNSFQLKSSAVELERPAWVMPTAREDNQTPGVTYPIFGATYVDTNGVGSSEGISLAKGQFHFYGILVTTSNMGVLQTTLEKVEGNPDLYIREGEIPTLFHNKDGTSTGALGGAIYDRSMVNSTDTETANWVPLDGRTSSQLRTGMWYLAVHAAGASDATYKLKVSVGDVVDLAINAPSDPRQLEAGTWRYHKVAVPSGLPAAYTIKVNGTLGRTTLCLRDTVPPGNGTNNTSDLKSWLTDVKNASQGSGPAVYPVVWTSISTLTTNLAPFPVRPGTILYLGILAESRANYSVSIAANGIAVREPTVVEFYGGSTDLMVPAFSNIIVRVDVPEEATRWRHTTTPSANLVVYLEQGAVPIPGKSLILFTSTGAGSANSMSLVGWNVAGRSYTNAWPKVAGQSYFLLVTNKSASVESFTLTMNGRNQVTDDEDNDGLPDFWEYQWFGNTTNVANLDSDGDGVSNLLEYTDGTHPTDSASYFAYLTNTICLGSGSVDVSPGPKDPNIPRYPLGTRVTLKPKPDPGFSFIRWEQSATGREDPYRLMMDGHKGVTAIFNLTGDDLITALPLEAGSPTQIRNTIGYSKEVGEPNHAGDPGGRSIWWKWTATNVGKATISATGVGFNTLLGVYTGTAVDNLTPVPSDRSLPGDTNGSSVTFTNVAGEEYFIAVDGVRGASGDVTLSLSFAGNAWKLTLLPPIFTNGVWQLPLKGEPGRRYSLEYSTNLTTWTQVATGTNDSAGKLYLPDTTGVTNGVRYYRGVTQ